jgi:hypothetical protein
MASISGPSFGIAAIQHGTSSSQVSPSNKFVLCVLLIRFELSHTTEVSALIDTVINLPTNPPSLYIDLKGVLDTFDATSQSQFSN